MSKGLLVTGATGKQGGATIDALLTAPGGSAYTILAVTRSAATSPSAQRLTSKASNVKIVQGDMDDVPAIFYAAKAVHPSGVWGVLSIQAPVGKGQTVEKEEIQGKTLVDEALKSGVKQFVYSSVDRGGDQKSASTATPVPHFASKYNIEQHLIKQANGSGMDYTILRPVGFMENLTPDFMGKMFGAMWIASLPKDRKLQLVSTTDVGHFAAQAFLRPEQYKNRALSLAGDDLTFAETSKIFKEKTGSPAPHTYSFLGRALMWAVGELGIMFTWFKTDGYGADIPALKKEYPGLKNLGEWLEQNSAFSKKD
ncbi:hypothetical protein AAFC00_004544 [Neodothiora populina]|uniref:NmrA-like domain-containing protein n=1 Tax=Neodothiora populina TaxID=2781224 RepID=A0ABR3P2D0_9PEZI